MAIGKVYFSVATVEYNEHGKRKSGEKGKLILYFCGKPWMVEAGYWKSAKLIPQKCGKAQLTSLIRHRCGKLIPQKCGKIDFSA